MGLVRIARDHNTITVYHLGRRVPASPDQLCLVKFNLLAVIDIGTECPLDRIDVSD